jgi:NAD(P)-dependent dehydrogenase (short-subunit alcohol dehydrogenase family)
MRIRGSVVIVTGGASGLGEATVRLLVDQGATVVVFDRNADGARAVASELGARHRAGDVADASDVEGAVELAAGLGPLRGLVNCAGIPRSIRTIGRDGSYASAHSLDQFERVLRVNLLGTFNCIRLAASAMSQNALDDTGERGSIVNTASIAAFDGQIGQAAYSASKGGIVSMTLPIARDLAVAAIRVNTIAPGAFETPIMGTDETATRFHEMLGPSLLFPARFGRPDEFARLVAEVLANPYMNAETVRMDGGMRMAAR